MTFLLDPHISQTILLFRDDVIFSRVKKGIVRTHTFILVLYVLYDGEDRKLSLHPC